jgi:hypothetical protein
LPYFSGACAVSPRPDAASEARTALVHLSVVHNAGV